MVGVEGKAEGILIQGGAPGILIIEIPTYIPERHKGRQGIRISRKR